MTIPKREPSFTKQIRTLLAKAGWTEGQFVATLHGEVRAPTGEFLAVGQRIPTDTEIARAEFVAAACNHVIRELAPEQHVSKNAGELTVAEAKAQAKREQRAMRSRTDCPPLSGGVTDEERAMLQRVLDQRGSLADRETER